MNQKEKDPIDDNEYSNWMIDIWEKFNVFSTIKDTDTLPIMIGKVIVRIIGFFVLLALSPFIFIGFLLAFAAVS